MSQLPSLTRMCSRAANSALRRRHERKNFSLFASCYYSRRTAPRIRDRNEFSRVWINKKSSDRVTSRSRDRSRRQRQPFRFRCCVQRSYLLPSSSIRSIVSLDDCKMISFHVSFFGLVAFLSSPFISNLAYFRFVSLQNSSFVGTSVDFLAKIFGFKKTLMN